MLEVKVEKKADNVILPEYKTSGAAGADLYAYLQEDVTIQPYKSALIPTGLIFQIPDGYEVQVRSRSGLALKSGIIVLNSPGTIDSDYRGEIGVILFNTSDKPFTVHPNDRIAQAVLNKVEIMQFKLDKTSQTQRASGGFGSTKI